MQIEKEKVDEKIFKDTCRVYGIIFIVGDYWII